MTSLKIIVCVAILISISPAARCDDSFRVPDPEEIYESFQDGFIDYNDYLTLLEISRRQILSAADSAFIRQFPDLMAGLSTNPLIAVTEGEKIETKSRKEEIPVKKYSQNALFRQYHRFSKDDDRKWLLRLRNSYGRYTIYGEYEEAYSGRQKWDRRYIDFDAGKKHGYQIGVRVGNFNDEFGLGLIYGYHGQLLSHSDDPGDMERFLYPGYGGSNGVRLIATKGKGHYKIVFDSDRNEDFRKEHGAVSIPMRLINHDFQLSGGWGQLTNRADNVSVGSGRLSLYGKSGAKKSIVEYEFAMAEIDGKAKVAAALNSRWQKLATRLNLSGWHYDNKFPSWFSGGPSSRRYRTIELDEIDLSFSDRFAGESGLVARVVHNLSTKSTLNSAFGYAWRGHDDNRLEIRLGLAYKPAKIYRLKIDFYRREDNSYFENRHIYKTQIDLVRSETDSRIRLVMGHRYDRYGERDDFLVFLEGRFVEKFGRLIVSIKVDRIDFRDLINRYTYFALAHETKIGSGFRSYVKYSYRYRRGTPQNSYGMLRWDIAWDIS